MQVIVDVPDHIVERICASYGQTYNKDAVVTAVVSKLLQQIYDTMPLEEVSKDIRSIVVERLNEKIKEAIVAILEHNKYDTSNLEDTTIIEFLNEHTIELPEDKVKNLYQLADFYFEFTGEVNPYGRIVELIASHDLAGGV